MRERTTECDRHPERNGHRANSVRSCRAGADVQRRHVWARGAAPAAVKRGAQIRRMRLPAGARRAQTPEDRKSTRLNSSHSQISYAVFCLKKKTHTKITTYRPD